MPNVMAAMPDIVVALCSTPRKVWLTPTTPSNAAKTRNPLKFAGVPQTTGPISAANCRSSPYCECTWRRYCCSTLFSDCRYVPQLRRYSSTNLCDGDQMAIFGDFLRPVFSASRVQHVSDLHMKFAPPCVEVWQTSNPICDG